MNPLLPPNNNENDNAAAATVNNNLVMMLNQLVGAASATPPPSPPTKANDAAIPVTKVAATGSDISRQQLCVQDVCGVPFPVITALAALNDDLLQQALRFIQDLLLHRHLAAVPTGRAVVRPADPNHSHSATSGQFSVKPQIPHATTGAN